MQVENVRNVETSKMNVVKDSDETVELGMENNPTQIIEEKREGVDSKSIEDVVKEIKWPQDAYITKNQFTIILNGLEQPYIMQLIEEFVKDPLHILSLFEEAEEKCKNAELKRRIAEVIDKMLATKVK